MHRYTVYKHITFIIIKNAEALRLSASVVCSWPVSRILYGLGFCERRLNRFPSFIWSWYRYHALTTYPPASDEQSLSPEYMVFQPIRCTAPDVAIRTGKLLPHLFTLSLRLSSGRLFSVTLLYPHGYLPVRKHGALCCPDFPFQPSLRSGRDDGTACCAAKVIKWRQMEKTIINTIFVTDFIEFNAPFFRWQSRTKDMS
jgi:hypothetical protein